MAVVVVVVVVAVVVVVVVVVVAVVVTTYVGITVVLEALFITSPRDQQQAITDLKGYKHEFESQKMQLPAALMRKVDEVLLGN